VLYFHMFIYFWQGTTYTKATSHQRVATKYLQQ